MDTVYLKILAKVRLSYEDDSQLELDYKFNKHLILSDIENEVNNHIQEFIPKELTFKVDDEISKPTMTKIELLSFELNEEE